MRSDDYNFQGFEAVELVMSRPRSRRMVSKRPVDRFIANEKSFRHNQERR